MLVVTSFPVEHAVDARVEPATAKLSDGDQGLRRVEELALVASHRAVVQGTVSSVRTPS